MRVRDWRRVKGELWPELSSKQARQNSILTCVGCSVWSLELIWVLCQIHSKFLLLSRIIAMTNKNLIGM
jgi:hypothetical protein